MANVVENMSIKGHLAEAMKQLEEAHLLQKSFSAAPERATAAATIAQTHLMMVQLGINEGRLPQDQ